MFKLLTNKLLYFVSPKKIKNCFTLTEKGILCPNTLSMIMKSKTT